MQLKIMALGNLNVTRRISDLLAGTKIDLITLSDVPEAIARLKQEKFDLALVDSGIKDVESVCYYINHLSHTPVALITRGSLIDWNKLRNLEVDGFIPEECPQIEMLAHLWAIARRRTHQFSRIKILIIEDDASILESLKLSFRVFWPQAELSVADNGEDGMKQARETPCDLILLDLGLTIISGFQVLERIRAFSLVPVIVLTDSRDRNEVIRAMGAGADDYVAKPLKQSDLFSRIRHHVELVPSLN